MLECLFVLGYTFENGLRKYPLGNDPQSVTDASIFKLKTLDEIRERC